MILSCKNASISNFHKMEHLSVQIIVATGAINSYKQRKLF